MAVEKMKKAVKTAVAKLSGETGILATLQGEHAEVSALMEKILSDADDADTRRKHYPTIRENLLAHARAEQEVLYAACEEQAQLRPLIRDDIREHREIEARIAELDGQAMDGITWLRTFEKLHDVVEHHVDDEENELFPRCQDIFPNDELKSLDDRYQTAKKRVKETL